MKKVIPLLLAALLLAGCASAPAATVETTAPVQTTAATEAAAETAPVAVAKAPVYTSRFDSETVITLSDDGLTVNGGGETDTVYTSHDIVYYEEKTAYESGNPYGAGSETDMHTAEEAQAHTVVNITAPGAYRLSGKLSAGQIRIDLGEDAASDPDAVVELILDGADITCTVAPAILFRNVYECDGGWNPETAQPTVDTADAGANLILAENSRSTVSGSYVAKIYKDAEGEKKLWKQDGAVYSYMSMNVYGPGALGITAENEGLDSALHLTVNGGTVVASANPASDAGLDSDMGSFVNGGTVIALGSTMDWAESDSNQVTMNLQFSQYQSSGSAIVVTKEDGTVIFAYDPSEDEVLGENMRQYMGAVISCPAFTRGETYQLWLDGTVTGTETGGVYTSVTAYSGGTQMQYTGTDVGMGGMGGPRPEGGMPEDSDGQRPQPGDLTPPDGDTGGQPPEKPDGDASGAPGDGTPPDGERPPLPEGETMPDRQPPEGGQNAAGEASTGFYMNDMVNAFSGITAV